MELERWNFARSMTERMVNTMVLDLWKYVRFAMNDAYFIKKESVERVSHVV